MIKAQFGFVGWLDFKGKKPKPSVFGFTCSLKTNEIF